jgi:hypothetical protein
MKKSTWLASFFAAMGLTTDSFADTIWIRVYQPSTIRVEYYQPPVSSVQTYRYSGSIQEVFSPTLVLMAGVGS